MPDNHKQLAVAAMPSSSLSFEPMGHFLNAVSPSKSNHRIEEGRKGSRKRHGMRQCVLRQRREDRHSDRRSQASAPSGLSPVGSTRPLHCLDWLTRQLHWSCRVSTDKPERHEDSSQKGIQDSMSVSEKVCLKECLQTGLSNSRECE